MLGCFVINLLNNKTIILVIIDRVLHIVRTKSRSYDLVTSEVTLCVLMCLWGRVSSYKITKT